MTDLPADMDAPPRDGGTHVGSEDDLGPVIDNYTLVERIGEGGFGVVYRAEQSRPVRREVALKIIKLGMDTKEVIARFAAERQALAMMEHPNISQVFDAGTTQRGRPYFVMELVRGVQITDYCDEAGLDIPARLDLFLAVCQAVQHAHQKGVIHRDLKPSNVLVTLHDGVAVPKVIDFGIAKATDQRLTDRTLFTEQHQLVGTPEYMSPEQADLTANDVDTRADVYSLGVLLYELLTGTPPHDLDSVLKEGFGAVLEHIREVDPPKPSSRVSTMADHALATAARQRGTTTASFGRTIGGDLDWIVMKTLEKDRTRRYESASALAADLERFRDDEPVLARPPSRVYRMRKYVRRHRVGVLASCAVGLALVIGGVLALRGYLEADLQLGRAQQAEVAAQREARDAEAARAEADLRAKEARDERDAKSTALDKLETASANLKTSLDKTDKALARARVMGLVHTSAVAERDDPMRALLLAREAVKHSTAAPVVTQLRSALRQSRERASFRGHRQAVNTVMLSPRGDLVVTASDDFIARLWNAKGGEVDFLSHNGLVYTAVFSPKGDRILTAAGGQGRDEGEARIWDLEGERLARLRGHKGHVFLAKYSPAADRILTASADGTAALWDAAGKLIAVLPVHRTRVSGWSAAFSATGTRVLTVSPLDGMLRTWDLEGKPGPTTRLRPAGETDALPMWIGARRILCVAPHGGMRVFDHEGKALGSTRGHRGTLIGAQISPLGDHVVTHYLDGTVNLHDVDGNTVIALRGHEEAVLAAAFSPRGDRVVTGSADGTARLWDLEGNSLGVLRGHEEDVTHVSFLPDGERVFTIDDDRVVRLWAADGQEVAVVRGQRGVAPILRATSTGGRVLLPMPDGSARLLDEAGRLITSLRVPGSPITWGALDPAGKYVLTGSAADPYLHLWDESGSLRASVGIANQGEWLNKILKQANQRAVPPEFAPVAVFSPAGDRFATISVAEGALRVWGLDGDQVFGVTAPGIRDVAFSPTGDRLLIGGGLGEATIVTHGGSPLHQLRSGGGAPADLGGAIMWSAAPTHVSFSADGSTVFAALDETTGHAWSRDGKKLCSFQWRDAEFEFVTFSPESDRVFAAMDDKCAYLWDLKGNPPAVFRGHDGVINFAVFSPAGGTVLTCSDDKTARLWDLEGNVLCEFGGHERPVTSAMFSPGGDRIVTASPDGTVRVYLARTEALIKLADKRITRAFSREERDRYGDLLGESDK